MSSEPCTILVPVYNEEGCVASVIDDIQAVMAETERDYELIVVDDGSTDRSADLAAEKDVTLLRHPSNRGYGAALKTGIREAGHDIVVIADADGTYPVTRIPDLLKDMDVHHMVVGARTGRHVAIRCGACASASLLGRDGQRDRQRVRHQAGRHGRLPGHRHHPTGSPSELTDRGRQRGRTPGAAGWNSTRRLLRFSPPTSPPTLPDGTVHMVETHHEIGQLSSITNVELYIESTQPDARFRFLPATQVFSEQSDQF